MIMFVPNLIMLTYYGKILLKSVCFRVNNSHLIFNWIVNKKSIVFMWITVVYIDVKGLGFLQMCYLFVLEFNFLT